jgi:hypothetical protein
MKKSGRNEIFNPCTAGKGYHPGTGRRLTGINHPHAWPKIDVNKPGAKDPVFKLGKIEVNFIGL